MAMNMLRPPISYIGGKQKYVKTILKLIPKHKIYVEAFGGSAAVLLNKPRAEFFEVYNDLEVNVSSMFYVLSKPHLYHLFKRYVSLMFCARGIQKGIYYPLFRYKEDFSILERARLFFLLNQTTYNAKLYSTKDAGFRMCIGQVSHGISECASSVISAINRLDYVAERMEGVIVRNNNYKAILRDYDSCDTFFYLDPPYLPDTRGEKKLYEHEMSYEEHEEFINIVSNLNGKVLISCYDSELYRSLHHFGFCKVSFSTYAYASARTRFNGTSGIGGLKKDSVREEVLYFNY